MPASFDKQKDKQKKIVLAAVNASYVHSNPAVYALRRSAYAYAERTPGLRKDGPCGPCDSSAFPGSSCIPGSSCFPRIEIAEYTINDRYEDILFGLIRENADVIGMSVYIWNARICLSLLKDLRRLRPAGELLLFAGGPEAATHPEEYLDSCDFVLSGEGEYSFSLLCASLSGSNLPDGQNTSSPDYTSIAATLPGAVFLKDGKLCFSSAGSSVPQMGDMPFLYDGTEDFANRIVYYESSRGCPFRCTYCLSSLDAPVRFRRLETVLEELQFFLDRRVSLVKFVDRTFNANASRARAIWTYIREHDNHTTCFHFEIGADLLQEEDLALLRSLRLGLIQLEIGIQSANPETLAAIRRTADNEKIFHAVRTLAEGQNIALHTDLIAGLPYEDAASFAHSFNLVYALRAHQFQLGFLKVLAGTEMKRREKDYGLVCSSRPPYTVIRTKWMTAGEIDRLRGIADMVDIFWNSGLFRHALPCLEKLFPSAFDMYDALLDCYRRRLDRKSLSPRARADFLSAFAKEAAEQATDGASQISRHISQNGRETFSQQLFEELLRFDTCLHFHPSRRMTAEETFRLPPSLSGEPASDIRTEKTGSVRILFDYSQIHPVTREARWEVRWDGSK